MELYLRSPYKQVALVWWLDKMDSLFQINIVILCLFVDGFPTALAM
jgi:hypothetical protein